MKVTITRYTSSREADASLAIARIAAAGRVAAERTQREVREQARARAQHIALQDGASLNDEGEVEYCFICSRATDHWGEHTPEQIDAWRSRRPLVLER